LLADNKLEELTKLAISHLTKFVYSFDSFVDQSDSFLSIDDKMKLLEIKKNLPNKRRKIKDDRVNS